MRKINTTGKVWILLAILSLLVHIFVPHHHHGNDICFPGMHCSECAKEVHHHEGLGHKDGHGENEDVCLLKQISILPNNEIKIVCIRVELNKSQHDHQLVSFFIHCMMQQERELTAFNFLHTRHPETFHSLDIPSADTLRAPPMV